MSSKEAQQQVVVVGAGVIGLTCALHLVNKGHKVLVVAKHFPGDLNIEYTSPWAGANWRSVCANDDHQQIAFEKESFHWFWQLAVDRPDLAQRVEGVDYVDKEDEPGYATNKRTKLADVWFKDFVPDFRVLSKSELPPGAAAGISYKTLCINSPNYLRYLKEELDAAGVAFIRKPITHITQAYSLCARVDAVFNCTGLGARFLPGVADTNVYPTRGQTVLIENTHNFTKTMGRVSPDYISYVIPRPKGGIIIGGCQDVGNWSFEVDHKAATDYIRRAIEVYPEHHGIVGAKRLEDVKIISHNVGLRPSRTGGARVECEYIKLPDGSSRPLIHAYGIGGWGYQAGYGMAASAVRLLPSLPPSPSAKL